ncbi:hypothetical protein D0T56_01570 [Dysgonomonas sp. 520]|nr:hypothetical protein [Dysgonomonas sp. 520]
MHNSYQSTLCPLGFVTPELLFSGFKIRIVTKHGITNPMRRQEQSPAPTPLPNPLQKRGNKTPPPLEGGGEGVRLQGVCQKSFLPLDPLKGTFKTIDNQYTPLGVGGYFLKFGTFDTRPEMFVMLSNTKHLKNTP